LIIELRKYNKAEELLIETRTAGHSTSKLLGRGLEAPVTRELPHGVKRQGCKQVHGLIQSASKSGLEQLHMQHCGAIRKALASIRQK